MSSQSTMGSPKQLFDSQGAENAYTDSGTSPPSAHASNRGARTTRARIAPGQQATGQLGGLQLARRRYQKGHLRLRGKREKVWIGRWLEDEIQSDGTVVRRHKSEVLGTLKQFPTKRLAQRELDARVSVVNSPTYRARPTATFQELAERWKLLVMPNHEDSTQRSEKSDIKAWVEVIGDVLVKDIDCELIQSAVTGWKKSRSTKTIRNRVATFRLIWDKAKAWRYVAHTAYEGLDLPDYIREEQPSFTAEDVKRIIAASKAPYDTIWRLVAETGIRRGEICGLNVGDVDLANRVITVRRSVSKKRKLKSPKNGKARVLALSPQLAAKLQRYVEGRSVDEPLFLSKKGKRLEPDNFVKRHLKPILKKLGLDGAAHAFRHGNATLLDSLRTSLRVRQDRLGHADPKTTMLYTHSVSEDDRSTAEQLGAILEQGFLSQDCPKLPPETGTAPQSLSEAVG
jgi:integrase